MLALIEITIIFLAVICAVITGLLIFGFYMAYEDYKVKREFYEFQKRFEELDALVNGEEVENEQG